MDPALMPSEDVAVRKVFRRFAWFFFCGYVLAFLDRINIGFAALSMNKDLALSAAAFGLAGTFFATAYLIFEIPSNLMLGRFGPRFWLSRIMVTWGLVATATMFATGAVSLYGIRALLGVAEAGFVPGVLVFLTIWFPRSHRARILAILHMANVSAIILGSWISGFILNLNHVGGLAGWRWLFLIEGLPAVALGVFAYFYLDDAPAKAKWLNDDEKAALKARLARDRIVEEAATGAPPSGIMRQLFNRNILLLAVVQFAMLTSLNGAALWTPQIIRSFAASLSLTSIGFVSSIPALVALVALPLWSISSDRLGERPWHLRIALLLAAAGWIITASIGIPAVQVFGLVCAACGGYCAIVIFWSLATSASILSPEARPAGIALINTIGIAGTAISPTVMGVLKDLYGSFVLSMAYCAVVLVIAVVCVTIVTMPRRSALASAPSESV